MPASEHYSRNEILRLVRGPAVATDLLGGGVMILKGGVVGLGWSRDEAASDWWRQLGEIVARPKPTLGEAGLHTPLDDPTEFAPSVEIAPADGGSDESGSGLPGAAEHKPEPARHPPSEEDLVEFVPDGEILEWVATSGSGGGWSGSVEVIDRPVVVMAGQVVQFPVR